MPKFNDFDLADGKRKEYEDIMVDSLWIINQRDKTGKHDNFYHWNFVPQIPHQLMRRYTKKDDRVIDPFLWSATTAVEAEVLGRNVVWVDIQPDLVDRADTLFDKSSTEHTFICWDSSVQNTYTSLPQQEFAQLVLLHPPYHDIIKFSDNKEDLSNINKLDEFLKKFGDVVKHSTKYLKKWWYVWLVIWDMYRKSERIPLGFYCWEVCKTYWLQLKSIIVKNMEWNRWKIGSWGIRRYRALSSDYYLFKHEYIFIFKKK